MHVLPAKRVDVGFPKDGGGGGGGGGVQIIS